MPTNRSVVDDTPVPVDASSHSFANGFCNEAPTQTNDTVQDSLHPCSSFEISHLPKQIHVTLSTPPNGRSSLNSSDQIHPPNCNSSSLPIGIKQTRQGLPQLAIPSPTHLVLDSNIRNHDVTQKPNDDSSFLTHTRSESQSDSTTPETPASLSSPIVGVVDLTKHVRTTSKEAECHGGYSDIYCGEWEREQPEDVSGSESSENKTKMVKVAIKLLRVLSSNGYDEGKARKRLNREVYVWHRLEHPNIVTFLGTSYHMSGRPSLVLPWFSNGCAPEYLRRNPHADRLRLILDIARGLQYLHTMKPPIVHGDLKGNNILITDDGRATLSDFGLAQVIEQLCSPQTPEYTLSDLGFGPIRWQAPELLSDDIGSPKMPGDIWSFGCTCYELLTGNIPYHFRTRDPLVMQDIQAGIRPPGSEENEKRCGDGGIWDLMNECWITSPDERIQINDVVSRLEDICAGDSHIS